MRRSGLRAWIAGRRTEDGGRRTEDGGRRAEDGGRRTEGGRQWSVVPVSAFYFPNFRISAFQLLSLSICQYSLPRQPPPVSLRHLTDEILAGLAHRAAQALDRSGKLLDEVFSQSKIVGMMNEVPKPPQLVERRPQCGRKKGGRMPGISNVSRRSNPSSQPPSFSRWFSKARATRRPACSTMLFINQTETPNHRPTAAPSPTPTPDIRTSPARCGRGCPSRGTDDPG